MTTRPISLKPPDPRIFQVNCETDPTGSLRAAADSLTVTAGQRVRREGGEEMWNDPLNWHTRDGHTFRERKGRAQETVFPEVPAHGCRADGDLRGRRRVGQGARDDSAVPLQVAAQA